MARFRLSPKGKPIQVLALFVAFMVMLGVAAYFRLSLVEERPFHADEAENAYQVGQVIEGDSYQFNPKHHHGPTLNAYLVSVQRLLGIGAFADLEASSLRASVIVLGIVSIGIFATWILQVGKIAALISVGLAAVSSLLVYYQSYVIHETLLTLGVIVTVTCYLFWLKNPNHWFSLIGGLAVGCMISTKLTSFVILGSLVIGSIPFTKQWQTVILKPKRLVNDFLIFLGGIFLVWLTFYSQFFTQFSGLLDFFQSPFVYEIEDGHSKPWYYFFDQFILPNFTNPFWSHETVLIVGVLLGLLFAIKRFRSDVDWGTKVTRFLIISCFVQITLFSLIPYKTPWLMMSAWLLMVGVAGFGYSRLIYKSQGFRRFFVVLVLVVGIVYSARTAYLLNTRFATDSRNPLAYVATSRNVEKLQGFVMEHAYDDTVAVIGNGNWPIPWYLRKHSDVSYHTSLEGFLAFDWVVLNDSSYKLLEHSLPERHDVFPFTLRENFPVYVVPVKTD